MSDTFDDALHQALIEPLFGWLGHLNLPEPELVYPLPLTGTDLILNVAFPDQQLGLILDPSAEAELIELDGWTIWRCRTIDAVFPALEAISQRLGATSRLIQLDFKPVEQLFGQGLYDTAKEKVGELQASIQKDHPDWGTCEEWRKKIGKAIREEKRRTQENQGEQSQSISTPSISRLSIAELLKWDAQRLNGSMLPPHNFLGLFTPFEPIETGEVDAVWVANVNQTQMTVWPATVTGHPTYQHDPAWSMIETDIELLKQTIHYLGERVTFVWQSEEVLPLLRAWHFRATGNLLPEILEFIDLRALCLVAFPMAKRTDRPEALCLELNLNYRDELGNGGTLAAMAALLQACTQHLRSLDDGLRAALRATLGHPVWTDRAESRQMTGTLNLAIMKRPALPRLWLDTLLPPSASAGFQVYLEHLVQYYQNFPLPIQQSHGEIGPSSLTVEDFLRTDGFLATVVGPDYRVRDGQLSFAQQVATATREVNPYVLEAGTGIGKTIGYLVPLLLSNKRCYVSTHTKNLQDQAWFKDVPQVLRAFEAAKIGRTVAILKGKNNYVCLQTVSDWLAEPDEVINLTGEAFALASLLRWLVQTQTGWLSEIEGIGQGALLARLGRDQAPPTLSETWNACDPHTRAYEASSDANIVLVNHSFVFAMAKHQNAEDTNVEVLVFDEAHNIEDVATEALTLDFIPWVLRAELTSLVKRDDQGKIQGVLRSVLEHSGIHTVTTLQEFRQSFLNLETRLDRWCTQCADCLTTMCTDLSDLDPDLPVLFQLEEFWGSTAPQPAQELKRSSQELQAALVMLALATETLLVELPQLKGIPLRLQNSLSSFLKRLQENAEALAALLTEAADQVRWGEAAVDTDMEGQPRMVGNKIVWQSVFHSTPVDVAAWLCEKLPPLYQNRIYVSATLAVNKDFSSIINRLGLQAGERIPEAKTAIYPSPFNYAEQVLLAVPSDAPYPRASTDPLYIEALSTSIAELVEVSEGRTLVLFTSRRAMQDVAIRLQATLKDLNIVVLAQSDTNRTALIERFKQAPAQGEKIVLLGLRAFWEGVDVPGQALVILVVSRLPFDYAGHPIAAARRLHYEKEHFDSDYFSEVIIPTTFLHLRQMYGRLIRKEDDRGVCIITDPRLTSKQYGRRLLVTLPGSKPILQKRRTIQEQVRLFLSGQQVSMDIAEPEEIEVADQELSPEQKAIVESPAERISVRAAAGSGKTSVLIRRIVRLVESNIVQPDRILALTYTNKAQQVMIERLEKYLGSKAYDLTRNVLTYHKFAARIIRQDDRGTGQETKFLNENAPELQATFFAEAREVADLSEKDLPDEDALTVIAYAQNGLVNEDELVQILPELEIAHPYVAKLGRFYLAYVEQLRQNHLIDYGEAIVQAVRILRDNTQAKQMWSGRFQAIFCDEYQDTTPAQAALLSLIGQHKQLFVVGDSAQSIYSWQGADPDNLRRFEVDFPNTLPLSLDRNYRCFPNLVLVSNRFLERCGQAHGIKIHYDERRSTEDQNVYYLTSPTDHDEAAVVAKIAGEALQLQIPEEPPRPGTVGILARKWGLLSALEEELIRQELPYRYEGETARGLSVEPGIRQIIDRAVDLLRYADEGQQMGDTPDGKAVRDLRERKITLATELLARAEKVIGSRLPDTATNRIYQRLLRLLQGKPAKALQKLYGAQEHNRLVLSTVHSQKGEEFDSVFVLGLEKGNSPHHPPPSHALILEWRRVVQQFSHATWRAALTNADLQRMYEEEEQRIFYVAMTRARFNLMICRAEQRNNRSYRRSEFLDQARVYGAIQEVASDYDVSLAKPSNEVAETIPSTDGRVFQTNAGIKVRSKSEMLLANEFWQRGMYFNYEEPLSNVPGALPDFTFPDYGDIVLEHLGLLTDPDYSARWEAKSQRYAQQNIPFFHTTEQDIQDLPNTVDRLRSQFRQFVKQKYGDERVQLIDWAERLRRTSNLGIGQAIGPFRQGIFAVEDNPAGIIAVALVNTESEPVLNPTPPDVPNLLGYSNVVWQGETIGDFPVWVAKEKED